MPLAVNIKKPSAFIVHLQLRTNSPPLLSSSIDLRSASKVDGMEILTQPPMGYNLVSRNVHHPIIFFPPPGFQGFVAAEVAAIIRKKIIRRKKKLKMQMSPVPVGKRTLYDFVHLGRIGQGTFGVVSRAMDTYTGEIVAIKEVKMEASTIVEIKRLSSIRHPAIVRLNEVLTCDLGGVYMVLEWGESDLRSHLVSMRRRRTRTQRCDEVHARETMSQLLHGVLHLHRNGFIHHDLKPSNLLLTSSGALKICDFGECRRFHRRRPLCYTHRVGGTLMYLPPELLVQPTTTERPAAIDMWAVGCIMAELLGKKPLFRGGRDAAGQMIKIVATLGKPTEVRSWGKRRKRLQKLFPPDSVSSDGLDLLTSLLTQNPMERITANTALRHPWFREHPM